MFHARFEQHAIRIMRRYGFDIVATWESSLPQGTRFVYLLNWPDVETKETAWRRFLADDHHLLVPTPYSPSHVAPPS